MYALEVSWISLIFLIPLCGALLNGAFGARLGKGFVRIVGVLAPAAAFVIALAAFFGLYLADAGKPTQQAVVTVTGPENVIQSAVVQLKSHPAARDWTVQRTSPTELRLPGRKLSETAFSTLKAGNPELKFSEGKRIKMGVVVVRGDVDKLKSAKNWLHTHDRNTKLWSIQESHDVLRIRNMELQDWTDDPALASLQKRLNLTVSPATAAPRSYVANLGEWIHVGSLKVDFKFHVDRLAIILMLVITGVGFLIHVYSTGYMGHESKGTFARYFCYLNLFVASMLVLVMADNLLLLFVGWEGVGMCSYLLIGFEYEDSDKAACGSKAFIVNRIGDLGFVLGMLGLLVFAANTGQAFSLEFKVLNQLPLAQDPLAPSLLLGGSCLLLFFGCTGKSAQLPLHLWLPDAMAGPTPVSALIHAATMVTAGVYLICRLSHVFGEAIVFGIPVLGIVAVVGLLTAFFAGCAAIAQDDIKSVLAYSTISQLGYMFVAVGAAAYGAAVFHLVTHAFFKAVLFLCAGAVIHSTHTQSMKEMGGLRRLMPTTFWTMTVGALALAGTPLLSGFFSKDMILFEALVRAKSGGSSPMWWLVYGGGVLTGFLTAVYSMRMLCMTFGGDYRGRGKPHPAPSSMSAPLVVLGVLAIGAGILGLPALFSGVGEMLPHYLAQIWAPLSTKMPFAQQLQALKPDAHTIHQLEIIGLLIGSAAAIAGLALGWFLWGGGRRPKEIAWETATTGKLGMWRRILQNAWYYDEVVNRKIVQPATKYLSVLLWKHIDDATLDRGLVDGTGRVAVQLSLFTRVFQTGKVARYAAYFVAGAVLLLLFSNWPTIYDLLKGVRG